MALGTAIESEVELDLRADRPWVCVVWDDPVNLMSYVVYVFQKLFGYPREKATRLMLQVHHEGRAAVTEGARELRPVGPRFTAISNSFGFGGNNAVLVIREATTLSANDEEQSITA